MKSSSKSEKLPWVKRLASISKQYQEIVTSKLRALDIDRYYEALLMIAEHENLLTQQTLAKKLETDKVSAMRMINYLSQGGYVRRVQNPDDRRAYLLKITAKGRQAIPEILKAFGEADREAFSGLTAEETASFFQLMKSIRGNLKGYSLTALKFNTSYEN